MDARGRSPEEDCEEDTPSEDCSQDRERNPRRRSSGRSLRCEKHIFVMLLLRDRIRERLRIEASLQSRKMRFELRDFRVCRGKLVA